MESSGSTQSYNSLNHDTAPGSIYSPLDTTRGHVLATRLVKILPDLTSDGEIACKLEPVFLDIKSYHDSPIREPQDPENELIPAKHVSHLESEGSETRASSPGLQEARTPFVGYWALSYQWGDMENSKFVRVNSMRYLVRPTLWNFLDLARRSPFFTKHWWWIDALCIDQSNIPERNHQVKYMGLIFFNAQTVVSWLGVNLEASDIALDIARAFLHELDSHPSDYVESRDSNHKEDLLVNICSRHSCSTKRFFTALSHLLRLEYWDRAWIAQETQLARRNMMLTGSNYVDMHAFVRCAAMMEHFQHPAFHLFRSSFYGLYTPAIFRRAAGSTPQILYHREPASRFSVAASLHCSDAKDRVYSQLSLIKDGQSFEVNYAEDNFSLFLRTVLYCSRNEGLLLEHVEFGRAIAHGLDISFCDLKEVLMLPARSNNSKSIYHSLWMACVESKISMQGVSYDLADHEHLANKTASAIRKIIHCPECHKSFYRGSATSFTRFVCLDDWCAHVSFEDAGQAEQTGFMFHNAAENISCRSTRSNPSSHQQAHIITISHGNVCMSVSTYVLLVYLAERRPYSELRSLSCRECSRPLEEFLKQEKSGRLFAGPFFDVVSEIHDRSALRGISGSRFKCSECRRKSPRQAQRQGTEE